MTDSNTVITIAQCDGVRFVGVRPRETNRPVPNAPIVLQDVGAIVIQRGVQPGALQGSIEVLKQVTISTIDYCTRPLRSLTMVPSVVYTEDDMDDESRTTLREAYQKFVDRQSNLITYKAANGRSQP